MMEKSPILKGKKIYHLPFGIDQNIFKPYDKSKARKELGINSDNIVLMFRNDENIFKGFSTIEKTLEKLGKDKKITLLSVGKKGRLKRFKNKFEIKEFDWIKNDKKLAKLYQSSDIFLMPSDAEAFGFMAIEAMSCGKLVLATKGTALEETINSPKCGIAVQKENYVNELKRLMENFEEIEQRGKKSMEYALQKYNLDKYLNKIKEIYKETISFHNQDELSKEIVSNLKKEMLNYTPLSKRAEYFQKSNWLTQKIYPCIRGTLLYFFETSMIKNYLDIKYDYPEGK
jgi:glycosyltransferase involved in cell wall biosynthesis